MHAGEEWKGKRARIISWYLNRQILEHFEKYGKGPYEQNRERLYGTGESAAAAAEEVSDSEDESAASQNGERRWIVIECTLLKVKLHAPSARPPWAP